MRKELEIINFKKINRRVKLIFSELEKLENWREELEEEFKGLREETKPTLILLFFL